MTTSFDDGKDDGALRTIGEVCKALDLKPHVLRYWEQQFSMLEPLKRSGGRRYYRPADVVLVERIDRLVNAEGYTLKGAQTLLAKGGAVASGQKNAPIVDNDRSQYTNPSTSTSPANTSEIVDQLKTIHSRLAAAIA